MAFSFGNTAGAVSGGNTGPDLETIQTEVSSTDGDMTV